LNTNQLLQLARSDEHTTGRNGIIASDSLLFGDWDGFAFVGFARDEYP
jgi:hypothetical protein